MKAEVLTAKESFILEQLSQQDTHGSELSVKSSGFIRNSIVYDLLHRMVARGLITGRWDKSGVRGGQKRVYKITEAGYKALKVQRSLNQLLEGPRGPQLSQS